MKEEQVQDWIDNGPPCLNCGERVPEAEVIRSRRGVAWRGMCRSPVCIKLPPGGNPFMFMVSDE